MFDWCGNKRWGSGNDFAKQEVMSLRTQTARKFDPWKQNGGNLPASKYKKVFHGVKHYDYESTATTKRYSYSVRFFRLLCSQTGRIRRNFNCSNYEKFEESYAQEINLIDYLHQLLGILNELLCHGKVGRPRFLVKFPTVLGQVLTVVFQMTSLPVLQNQFRFLIFYFRIF